MELASLSLAKPGDCARSRCRRRGRLATWALVTGIISVGSRLCGAGHHPRRNISLAQNPAHSLVVPATIDERKGRGLVLNPSLPTRRITAGTLLFKCDPYVAVQNLIDEENEETQVPLPLPNGWTQTEMDNFARQTYQLEKTLKERGERKGAKMPLFLTLRAVIRLLIYRNLRASESCKFTSVSSLVSHWESLPEERLIFYAQMATLIREVVGESLCPDVRETARLVSMLQINAMSVHGKDLRPIGLALYPDLALLNHGGEKTNCVITFDGWTAYLTAVKDLRPGDELLINYLGRPMTRKRRIEVLRSEYFVNTTEAKQQEENGPNPTDGEIEKIEKIDEQVSNDLADLSVAIQKSSEEKNMRITEGGGHARKLTMLDRIIWDVAKDCHRHLNESIPLYRKCYYPWDPVLYHQLLLLGKAAYYLRYPSAGPILREAACGLGRSHQPSHPLLKTADDLYSQVIIDFPVDSTADIEPPEWPEANSISSITNGSTPSIPKRRVRKPLDLDEVCSRLEQAQIKSDSDGSSKLLNGSLNLDFLKAHIESSRNSSTKLGNSLERDYEKWDNIASHELEKDEEEREFSKIQDRYEQE